MKITRRRVLGLLAGAAAVVGVPSIWISRMKTYAGPVSDHFDGTHFFDPDGVAAEIARRGAALAVRRRPAARSLAGMGAEPLRRYAAAAGRPATRCGCRSSATPAG